ncbi:MAG: hypothetical protein PVJ39_20245 [Gammaproteobacteria bacterium]
MTLVLAPMILASPFTVAACRTDAEAMYSAFKSYRQHLNTATHIDELKPYFSTVFNQYYMGRLKKLKSPSASGRFLARYWDNLNTAMDIVIVFDFRAHCVNNSPALELIAVLDTPSTSNNRTNAPNGTVQLWRITLYFVYEQNGWKIDSFEYQKDGGSRQYVASDIIDNFVRIR